MSEINAIKGLEIGDGFMLGGLWGSEAHDEMVLEGDTIKRVTNHSGGIEGGMSTTQPLHIRMVMKPIPTLRKPLRSVDIFTKEEKLAHKERTDACAVPAASVVAEYMLCLVLANLLLEKFGGDTLDQLKAHMTASARY